MSTVLAPPVEVATCSTPPSVVAPDQSYKILVAVSSPGRELNPELFYGIDWDVLLHHARHHSLVPLLAHRLLESHSGVTIPTHIRARLRNEFQSNLLRNFALLEEIRRILQAWRQKGIEAIPYKGPVLAEQLWGSFALRECSDLDFLVRREDVNRAGRVLPGLGYHAVSPVADSLRPALLRNASEEQFQHAPTGILLELQWAPAPRTFAVPYDEEQLWSSLTRISAAGELVNAPGAENLVGLLAIHGWKHNWSKLIWIADLSAVIRRSEIDWERLHESATRNRWRRILLLGLEMVRRIYGTPACDPLNADPEIASLAERLEQGLRVANNSSYLQWHRDMLLARDSRSSQIRQLANFILTPGLAEYSSSKLPAWASPAYRAIRLARVLSLWPQKART